MPIAPKKSMFMPVSHLCVGILLAWACQQSCTCCDNYHEFICATFLLFLENTIYLKLPTTSYSYTILIFSSWNIPEPCVDRCSIDTNLKLSNPLSLILAYYPALGLSVNCHLLQEVSLGSTGWCSDQQV